MKYKKIDLLDEILNNPKFRQILIEHEIMINNLDNN